MSKVLTALMILGVLGGGAYYTGAVTVPEFGVEDRGDWTKVTDDRIEITSAVWLNNENPLSLDINTFRANYRLLMNRVRIAEGVKKGLDIEQGNQTIDLKTDLLQKRIPDWWVRHIRKNENTRMQIVTDLRLDLFSYPLKVRGVKYSDSINTNIMKTLDSGVKKIQGNYTAQIAPSLIPQDSQPEIQIKGGSAKWGKVNKQNTEIKFQFKIHNPNNYPIPTPEMAGNIEMNGIELADWNANKIETLQDSEKIMIEPGETREIDFGVKINNSNIDDWLTSHIEKQEKTDATISLNLVFDFEDFSMKVPGGEGITCEFNFQTAILVDNQKTNTSFQGCQTPAGSIATGQQEDQSSNEYDSGPSSGNETENESGSNLDGLTEGLTG